MEKNSTKYISQKKLTHARLVRNFTILIPEEAHESKIENTWKVMK
jgi:hypothetical protein